MLEIRQKPDNQLAHYVYGTKTSKTFFEGTAEGCLKYIKNKRRNRNRRIMNQILRDISGTSARVARLDMGLAKS